MSIWAFTRDHRFVPSGLFVERRSAGFLPDRADKSDVRG
jgi:hypothetical protein